MLSVWAKPATFIHSLTHSLGVSRGLFGHVTFERAQTITWATASRSIATGARYLCSLYTSTLHQKHQHVVRQHTNRDFPKCHQEKRPTQCRRLIINLSTMSSSNASQMPTEDVASGLNAISANVKDFLTATEFILGDMKQRALESRRAGDQQSSTTENTTPKATQSTTNNVQNAARSPIVQGNRNRASLYAIFGHVIGPTLILYDAVTRLGSDSEDEEWTDEEDVESGDAMEQWLRAVLASKPFLDSVREPEGEEDQGP